MGTGGVWQWRIADLAIETLAVSPLDALQRAAGVGIRPYLWFDEDRNGAEIEPAHPV